jgi:EF hand
MKARILIATAAAALLPLAAAVAADNDQYGKEKDKSMMPDESFKKLDSNGDGRISQAEAAVDSTIVFTSADANGDGYLDSAEWKARTKGSASPTPQSAPSPSEEPATTPPPDTETPRQ